MSDFPDYDGLEDEAFPPLPPPHSPGLGGQDEEGPFADGEEDGDESKLAEVPAVKRKGVKRPQPKLDSQRLTSDRGLPALRTLFDNVRFKGKGHEAEDLRLLMQKMENWAHRLYPKLQFEDFIDRLEKLGNKKEVQTCLKRIRLDMPLTHEDYMNEDEAAPESLAFGDPDPFSRSFSDDLQVPVHSTPAPPAPSAPPARSPAPPSPAAPSLSEEQRKRMELNRQRALERKLARQQQTAVLSSSSQPADPSDLQTADSSSSAAEHTPSSPAANVHNTSGDRHGEAEDLDLESAASSSSSSPQKQQEQPSQPPQDDPEPPAEPPQRDEEEEPGLGRVHQASTGCEDGE